MTGEQLALKKLNKKLDDIQDALTNHVITEIKENRKLINKSQEELSLIRGSLGANKEGFRVLNDRVHALIEQLKHDKIIG